jgi:hypothetical protein
MDNTFLDELFQIYHLRLVLLLKLLKRSLICLHEYYKENQNMNVIVASLFYDYGYVLKTVNRVHASFHYQKEIPKLVFDSLSFLTLKLNELSKTNSYGLIVEFLNCLTVFYFIHENELQSISILILTLLEIALY